MRTGPGPWLTVGDERPREPADSLPSPGLFSRTCLAVTAGFVAVMFLTGFAARRAVMPLPPVAARDLDGVGRYPLVAGAFVAAGLRGGVLGAGAGRTAPGTTGGSWADRAGPGPADRRGGPDRG
ncbi:hypothetical protein AB0M23_00430 [Streptomyces sp. NPDC052077]|uniref:hypothetical protein n=1 Tax=Streptomyces sp. NPDC052077 TaxID=3154757 RepID=UPI0034436F57